MLKVEVFYDGSSDRETPLLADELKTKYSGNIDLYLLDISEDTAPEGYGIINPPAVVLDEKKVVQLEAPSGLSSVVAKAIF